MPSVLRYAELRRSSSWARRALSIASPPRPARMMSPASMCHASAWRGFSATICRSAFSAVPSSPACKAPATVCISATTCGESPLAMAAVLDESRTYVAPERAHRGPPIPRGRLAVEREPGKPWTVAARVHPTKLRGKGNQDAPGSTHSGANMHVGIADTDVLLEHGEERRHARGILIYRAEVGARAAERLLERRDLSLTRQALHDQHGAAPAAHRAGQGREVDLLLQRIFASRGEFGAIVFSGSGSPGDAEVG